MRMRWSRLLKSLYTHRVVLKRILVVAFAVLVLVLLVAAVLNVDWPAVIVALKDLPAVTLCQAAAVAILIYTVYGCFDLLGRHYVNHDLPWWRSVLVGFISYAFTMSLGSTIGGVGARIRLYTKLGLRQGEIVRIWAISVMTNWTGYLLMLGIALASGQVAIPSSWNMGRYLIQTAGVAGLCLVAAYLLASAFLRQRTWNVHGHTIELPEFRITLLQAILGASVWALVAAIPYVLFQDRVPYLQVLAIVLVSAVAGLAARIPGGLGVVEYVFITMLSSAIPRSEALAVVLVYRLFYYIGPLLVAAICYVLVEAGMKSISSRVV